MKMLSRIKKILYGIILLGLIGGVFVLGVDFFVKHTSSQRILTATEATELEDVDCVLVLGCQVKSDGSPSHMLRDRLDCGINLYKSGVASKILMSGDHGQTDYNEVGTMKQVAINDGVAAEDVFMDHAGFSTYESIYRAKEIFGVKKMVIVTQKYHLYRALYIAKQLGVEAYGVPSDYHIYAGQIMRDIREILARNKDFFTGLWKPEPTYLGIRIDIKGNGNVTND